MFELFPREQVLVLQFERCVQDPVGGDGAHLAVPRASSRRQESPERLLKHKQAGREHPGARARSVSEELAERYREDSARLAELCPEIDLSLWTSVAGERAREQPRRARRA